MPSTKSNPGERLSDCHLNNQRLINSLGAEVNESVGLIEETQTAPPYRISPILRGSLSGSSRPSCGLDVYASLHSHGTAPAMQRGTTRVPEGRTRRWRPCWQRPQHARWSSSLPSQPCACHPRRRASDGDPQLYNAPNCTANPAHEGPRRCQPITPAVCLEMQGPRYPA